MNNWRIFKGDGNFDSDRVVEFPEPPSWRRFQTAGEESSGQHHGKTFQARDAEIDAVNAAIYLRRPLLVTGKPGMGKTSLAYAVAYELGLGEVLEWPISTRTIMKDGLYRYDAIGRAQDAASLDNIGKYIQLGPLGTALLPSPKPRVLLIDEIDKSDIDFPNELLNVFEKGQYSIPELERIWNPEDPKTIVVKTADSNKNESVGIEAGKVRCQEFPLVIMTSNGERDFPAPFLRRCLRLTMEKPTKEQLQKIVHEHLGEIIDQNEVEELIDRFIKEQNQNKQLATDQLLNAVHMVTRHLDFSETNTDNTRDTKEQLLKLLLTALNERG
jgi:MoxR-like ATPase